MITFVSHPSLTLHRPRRIGARTPAIIVCPGGGYGRLAIDTEGHDIAEWLSGVGVAGLVLKYRLPGPDGAKKHTPWPMLDGARALRMVRMHAREWGIDPEKVGVMGFSAGGHLASTLGTQFDAGNHKARDPIDRFSSRPDFMVLIYPVITMHDPYRHPGSRFALLGDEPSAALIQRFSVEEHVSAQTPPAFLVHALNDRISKPHNSLAFSQAMERVHGTCEIHLLDQGGHGFGLGVNRGDVSQWPEWCLSWLRKIGVLPASPKP